MSDWLAAYEAQKAAVLAKMNAPNSSKGGSDPKGNSVTGTSGFSGLVNIDEVKHLSKKTQVTTLMNSLKKTNTGSPAPPKPPSTQSKQAPKLPQFPKSTSIQNPFIDQTSNQAIFNNDNDQAFGQASGQTAFNSDFTHTHRVVPESILPLKVTPTAPAIPSLLETPYNEVTTSASVTPGVSGSKKKKNKKKKKKKSSSPDGKSVMDLMKLVKRDSTKPSLDWREEYEKRKRETIANIASGKTEARVGSMSAFHPGALANSYLESTPAPKFGSSLPGASSQKALNSTLGSGGKSENSNQTKLTDHNQGSKPPLPPKALVANYGPQDSGDQSIGSSSNLQGFGSQHSTFNNGAQPQNSSGTGFSMFSNGSKSGERSFGSSLANGTFGST